MFGEILGLLCATKWRKDIKDAELKEEPSSCNHFFDDFEPEKGRHWVFNFTMPSFKNTFLNEKLDHVFNQLKCASKVNVPFAFVLINIGVGTCRYFQACEIITVM